jgi:hypothetical protein
MEATAQSIAPAPSPGESAAGSLTPTQLQLVAKQDPIRYRSGPAYVPTWHLLNLDTGGPVAGLCGAQPGPYQLGLNVYLAQDKETLLAQPNLLTNLWQPTPAAQVVTCKNCQAQLGRMLADGRLTPAKVQYLTEEPAPSRYRGAGPSAKGPKRPRVSTPKTEQPTQPKPQPPNMRKQLAQKVYNQVIKDLHGKLLNYTTPDGTRKGIAAFAETHKLGRQNLFKIFSQGANSISIGIYLKIMAGLGLLEEEALQDLEPTDFTLSLRLVLQLDINFIISTTTALHLSTLEEPAPEHV